MSQRIDYSSASPAVVKAMLHLQKTVDRSGLEHSLLELVKIRASQINGCARCLEMHFKDAKAAGESDERLYLLSAWREAPYYNDRERAALLWTETLTRVADLGAPEDVFNEVREQFDEAELVNLTLAIVAINSWNRFNVAFQTEVGNYEPGSVKRMLEAIAS